MIVASTNAFLIFLFQKKREERVHEAFGIVRLYIVTGIPDVGELGIGEVFPDGIVSVHRDVLGLGSSDEETPSSERLPMLPSWDQDQISRESRRQSLQIHLPLVHPGLLVQDHVQEQPLPEAGVRDPGDELLLNPGFGIGVSVSRVDPGEVHGVQGSEEVLHGFDAPWGRGVDGAGIH